MFVHPSSFANVNPSLSRATTPIPTVFVWAHREPSQFILIVFVLGFSHVCLGWSVQPWFLGRLAILCYSIAFMMSSTTAVGEGCFVSKVALHLVSIYANILIGKWPIFQSVCSLVCMVSLLVPPTIVTWSVVVLCPSSCLEDQTKLVPSICTQRQYAPLLQPPAHWTARVDSHSSPL